MAAAYGPVPPDGSGPGRMETLRRLGTAAAVRRAVAAGPRPSRAGFCTCAAQAGLWRTRAHPVYERADQRSGPSSSSGFRTPEIHEDTPADNHPRSGRSDLPNHPSGFGDLRPARDPMRLATNHLQRWRAPPRRAREVTPARARVPKTRSAGLQPRRPGSSLVFRREGNEIWD